MEAPSFPTRNPRKEPQNHLRLHPPLYISWLLICILYHTRSAAFARNLLREKEKVSNQHCPSSGGKCMSPAAGNGVPSPHFLLNGAILPHPPSSPTCNSRGHFLAWRGKRTPQVPKIQDAACRQVGSPLKNTRRRPQVTTRGERRLGHGLWHKTTEFEPPMSTQKSSPSSVMKSWRNVGG